MSTDILKRIVARRRERLAGSGPGDGPRQGLDIPARSAGGRHSFPAPVICEIKRRSPSRGTFAEALDPVGQAARYHKAGARAVSILTEQDHFGGSLADLVAVRRAFPDMAILRKDFLLTREDLQVARDAGADAVLLIAAILDPATLADLHAEAHRLGLVALVEIHDRQELEMIRSLRPPLVGINSRDLRTFRVDLLAPLALAAEIDWSVTLVFESGVFHAEDALVAREGGFQSLLVGEAVMRAPDRIPILSSVMTENGGDGAAPQADVAQVGAAQVDAAHKDAAHKGAAQVDAAHKEVAQVDSPQVDAPAAAVDMPVPFWTWCARRRGGPAPGAGHDTPSAAAIPRPLVKICGITNREDALLAEELGADMLGLVYADSPRAAAPGLARELARILRIPLVGVVVEGETSEEDDSRDDPKDDAARPNLAGLRRAQADLRDGYLAALQLHGSARPERALDFGRPYYKALRPASPEEAARAVAASRSTRILLDAHHRQLAGGTGLPVSEEILTAVRATLAERPQGELWLAGGLEPDTIAEVVRRWQPELVDASSRLETAPGKKDPARMRAFFHALTAFPQEVKG